MSKSTRRHADNSRNHADLWPIKIFHSMILRLNFTWNSLAYYTTCSALQEKEWSDKEGGVTEQRMANVQMSWTIEVVKASQPQFTMKGSQISLSFIKMKKPLVAPTADKQVAGQKHTQIYFHITFNWVCDVHWPLAKHSYSPLRDKQKTACFRQVSFIHEARIWNLFSISNMKRGEN